MNATPGVGPGPRHLEAGEGNLGITENQLIVPLYRNYHGDTRPGKVLGGV